MQARSTHRAGSFTAVAQAATESAPPVTTTQAADLSASTFIRMPGVIRWTGLGRSTIYRLMAEDRFPAPVLLGRRAVAWRRADLEQWSAARPTVAH